MYLLNKNIKFICQHKFIDCKKIKPLPFDFYIPDINTCIEYNGEQHYKSFSFFGGIDKLNKTQENDIIKLNYCKTNNINLIIINNLKSINTMLNKLFT